MTGSSPRGTNRSKNLCTSIESPNFDQWTVNLVLYTNSHNQMYTKLNLPAIQQQIYYNLLCRRICFCVTPISIRIFIKNYSN